jgi:hypothetical protein
MSTNLPPAPLGLYAGVTGWVENLTVEAALELVEREGLEIQVDEGEAVYFCDPAGVTQAFWRPNA